VAKKTSLAERADPHDLYQSSVQSADFEIDFFHRVFKKQRGRKAYSLREDFCGTALLSAAWVASDAQRTALGVDIDPEVLAWGAKHNVATLGDASERVQLLQQDVRARSRQRFDIVNAMNFSYWIFRTRQELRDYFICARRALVDDGVFFVDLYGGWEAQQPMPAPRKIKGGFTYVWDQASFDPITHEVVNHIHFEFKDGSRLTNAFTYEWRFWSLPEIKELLLEAGFSEVVIHWEKNDKYRPATSGESQPGWLAFVAALK
jgi:SAM-dependent methyltransferase